MPRIVNRAALGAGRRRQREHPQHLSLPTELLRQRQCAKGPCLLVRIAPRGDLAQHVRRNDAVQRDDLCSHDISFPVNRQEKAPQPFAPFDGHRLTDLWMHPREDSGLNFASRLEEIEFASQVWQNEF